MIGDILDAVLKECRAMLEDTGGTVILKTDYKPSNLPSYQMPLVLVQMVNAAEAYQYPGGATKVDWQFAMNSYNIEPDMMVDDETDYSTSLLNVIDDTRVHFSNFSPYLTTGMGDILVKYGFRFTLSGVMEADHMEQDGLTMGYKIVFDSMAIDMSTTEDTDSVPLEHVVQVDNPPFSDPE